MNKRNLFLILFSSFILISCAKYTTPPRNNWDTYLRGVSFTDMTETAKIAKRPVYLGAGGKLVQLNKESEKPAQEYGDKLENDNTVILRYMSGLEYELYNTLRKPGISVQRVGNEVLVILVRDAFMKLEVAEISDTGTDTLEMIADILKKYDSTFIEVAGYTDAVRDQNAAKALSLDMAQRAAIFLSRNEINTARMFIVGRGSARPIAAQDDIGRLTNRRIEIKISPAR